MAHALLERMAPLVQGTYIMPSFGRYELAAELVRRIRADARLTTSAGASAGATAGEVPAKAGHA